MSNVQALQDAFMKADALAQQGDQQARQDAQMFADEIRRLQSAPKSGMPANGFLGQFNKTVADAVDFVNPFDNEAWANVAGGRFQTPSAGEMMQSLPFGGAAVADDSDPDNLSGAAGKGLAQGAIAFLPIMKGLQALGQSASVGPAVRAFADDALRSMQSATGLGLEAAGAATSEVAREKVEQEGGGDTAQAAAAMLAPLGVAAAVPAARAIGGQALNAAEALPVSGPIVGAARRFPGQVAAAVAPYTSTGARRVAERQMVELAGGRERAAEIAARTTGENPLNLTPAQMANDPNFLALEQQAGRDDAALGQRLRDRAQTSVDVARQEIGGMGGDAAQAQATIADQQRRYEVELQARVDDVITRTNDAVAGIQPLRPNSQNSTEVMDLVYRELDNALTREKELWAAVPMDVAVPTGAAREALEREIANTSRAQADDIPQIARTLLSEEGGLGDQTTVRELHGLYSKLREISRNARAGNNTNPNMARIADAVADGILQDLDATPLAQSPAGRAINEARDFSAALHKTFDQGEVGRLLTKTNDGDTSTAPELALSRTVGRSGERGLVGDRDLSTATLGQSEPFVADYLRGAFSGRAFNASGEFTALGARAFMRDNAELLARYPQLRRDIQEAVEDRVSAEDFAGRVATAIQGARDKRVSAAARFVDGPPEKAFEAILADQNPARAAAKLVAAARKGDPSGEALAGIKGAFSDYLIGRVFSTKNLQNVADGDKAVNIMAQPKVAAALRTMFSPAELGRLRSITRQLAKLQESQRTQREMGELVETRANRLVEYAARVVAARQGAQLGGGMASLQTAQMASSRMREALGYLASDKASQLMADAVEDPELFRALLLEISPKNEKQIIGKLWPYLSGAVASEIQQ